MRLLIVVAGMALLAQASGAGEYFRPSATLADEAVALKCDDAANGSYQECVEHYQQAFSSGVLDPMAVLRLHCTRWDNPWDLSTADAPEVCSKHFDGWVAR